MKPPEIRQSWSAVFAMSLGAFALVASEFMPVSLLTPIAIDLRVTEGQAGQAVAISGAFALVTSVSISSLAKRVDRKILLLSLMFLMVLSGTIISLAPDYVTFMLGRVLIGISIGGFWSLSAATAMRLVSKNNVPRALAVLNGGNALASVIAAPAGSFLGTMIGWRGAFSCLVPIAVIAFCWKLFSLPALKPQQGANLNDVFKLLRRSPVAVGMVGFSVLFMGQFTLFTYLRPFLETVTHVGGSALSLMLLILGVAGFIGTVLIGFFLEKHLYRLLVIIPSLMALIALTLLFFGDSVPLAALLLAMWGLTATSAPVAWWTWLARTLPQDAEAGGGLIVAFAQIAIVFGATAGGIVFDRIGYRATFAMGAILLVVAAGVASLTARMDANEALAGIKVTKN